MLHVQETFTHSNLLMSPQIAVVAQPQASNSRTNKVVDQLSSRYEAIQKEMAAIKQQVKREKKKRVLSWAKIEKVRQTKTEHEKDIQYYTSSNKILRSRIKETVEALEHKQESLERTKQESRKLESKVKQLKDEALASRCQLEGLRRREQVLEHDRDVAVKERNQLNHKNTVLGDSVEQLRDQCEKEKGMLKRDYELLVEQSKYIKERNELMMELVNIKLKQRREQTDKIALMKRQSRANADTFIEYAVSILNKLKADTELSTCQSRDCTTASIQCSGEVNGLFIRMKTIAAEFTSEI